MTKLDPQGGSTARNDGAYQRVEHGARSTGEAEALAAATGYSQHAAHALMSVIRHISFFAQMIDEEAQASSSIHEHAEQIRARADVLGRMVRQLRDFDMRAAPAPTRRESARDLLAAAAAECGADLLIEGDAHIIASAPLVQRAFSAIIENARVHGGREEGVVISARIEAGSEGVLVEIADDGIGLPCALEQAERLFEPFEHTPIRNAPPRLGLGLSIARGFIEAQGGSVRFTSQGGGEAGGARITIILPSADPI